MGVLTFGPQKSRFLGFCFGLKNHFPPYLRTSTKALWNRHWTDYTMVIFVFAILGVKKFWRKNPSSQKGGGVAHPKGGVRTTPPLWGWVGPPPPLWVGVAAPPPSLWVWVAAPPPPCGCGFDPRRPPVGAGLGCRPLKSIEIY